jgi:hypothetical protein
MELISPFMAVNAFPMAEARASTPIFKNWAAVVPVFVMVALLSNWANKRVDDIMMIEKSLI